MANKEKIKNTKSKDKTSTTKLKVEIPKSKIKTQNFKHKTLALFQFFSTIAIICLLVSYFLITDPTKVSTKTVIKPITQGSTQEWNILLNKILIAITFRDSKATGILSGILFYTFVGLWMAANISGWLMFKYKNRNLFDQLFLVFLMLPIMSNLFALLSQLATKELPYTDSSFSKEKIIKEQTNTIKNKIKSELKETKERLNKSKIK